MIVIPILELSASDAYLLRAKGKSNVSLHITLLAASMHIHLKPDHFDRQRWTVQGGVSILRDHLIATGLTKIFNKLRQLQSSYPLFFTRQLLIDKGQCMSWAFYRYLTSGNAKGRPAFWYQQLSESLTTSDHSELCSLDSLWDLFATPKTDRRCQSWILYRNNSLSSRRRFYLGKIIAWSSPSLLRIELYDFIDGIGSPVLNSCNILDNWIPIHTTHQVIDVSLNNVKVLLTRTYENAPRVLSDWRVLLTRANVAPDCCMDPPDESQVFPSPPQIRLQAFSSDTDL